MEGIKILGGSLKRNGFWLLWFAFVLYQLFDLISELNGPSLILFFFMVGISLFCVFVGSKLGLHRRGLIPWYASPIFWLGIPVILFLFYFFTFL